MERKILSQRIVNTTILDDIRNKEMGLDTCGYKINNKQSLYLRKNWFLFNYCKENLFGHPNYGYKLNMRDIKDLKARCKEIIKLNDDNYDLDEVKAVWEKLKNINTGLFIEHSY